MKKVNSVTESRVAQAFEDLREEIEIATGQKSGRARFYGFRLMEPVKALLAEALAFFKEGQMNHADLKIREVRARFTSSQRGFAKNSVVDEGEKTSFFTRAILSLPHLDQDIEDKIEKKREAFRAHVRMANFDLDKASELSWALRDAILRAEDEQEARLRNREKRKLQKAVRQNEQKIDRSAEQAREVQLRHDAEKSAKRKELVDRLASELQLQ